MGLICGIPDEVLASLELLHRLERTRGPGGRTVQLVCAALSAFAHAGRSGNRANWRSPYLLGGCSCPGS
eukprot:scaffold39923_cov64-Phaeocystis_antarctica.AAC.2